MRKFKPRKREISRKDRCFGKRLPGKSFDFPAAKVTKPCQRVLCADHDLPKPFVRGQHIRSRAEDPGRNSARREKPQKLRQFIDRCGLRKNSRRTADAERRVPRERLFIQYF